MSTKKKTVERGENMHLTLTPLWEKLESVRENAKIFLSDHHFAQDDTNALVMIASELVENAIKYGNFEKEANIALAIDIEANKITVETKNPINKDSNQHLHNLDKTIQWIRGFQTPFEAYIERLRQVSDRQSETTESGLGLVRIAYEGQGILDFYISNEDVLAVSVVYPLKQESA